MRIIISALLLSLCLCACAPESSPSSVPSSEPEVTSGLEVQFDDPEEAPEITADLSGTALPWEITGTAPSCAAPILPPASLKSGMMRSPPPPRAAPSPSSSPKAPGLKR